MAGRSDHGGCCRRRPLHLYWLGSGCLRLGCLCLLFLGERGEELEAGGLIVERFGLHPWVGTDLLNSRALITLVTEELENQVLELLTEASAVYFLEIDVSLALEEQVVEVFFLAGLLEGEDSLNDDEQDDSNGEHVDVLALVHLALLDLGGHIGHGATVTLQ